MQCQFYHMFCNSLYVFPIFFLLNDWFTPHLPHIWWTHRSYNALPKPRDRWNIKLWERLYDPLQFLSEFIQCCHDVNLFCHVFFVVVVVVSSSVVRKTESEYIQYTIWYGNHPLFVMAKQNEKNSSSNNSGITYTRSRLTIERQKKLLYTNFSCRLSPSRSPLFFFHYSLFFLVEYYRRPMCSCTIVEPRKMREKNAEEAHSAHLFSA